MVGSNFSAFGSAVGRIALLLFGFQVAGCSGPDNLDGDASVPLGRIQQRAGAPGVALYVASMADPQGRVTIYNHQTAQAFNVGAGAPLDAAAGDVNQDGLDEVAYAASSGTAFGTVHIYGHSGPLEPQPYPGLTALGFQANDRIGMGDLNNDGFDDLVFAGHDPPGSSGIGIVVFTRDGAQLDYFPDLAPSSPDFPNGADMAVCDLNNDDFDDIVVASSGAGGWRIYTHPSVADPNLDVDAYFPGEKPGFDLFASRLACADVNNDGFDDLIIGRRNESCIQIATHPSVAPLAFVPDSGGDCVLSRPGDEMAAGDLNADGFAEIAIGGNTDSSLFGPLTVHSQLGHSVGDFLVGAASFREGSAITMGRSTTSPLLDSDDDGLPDAWEINGIYYDSDNCVDFDLKALGADPFRKDIFVEIDAMDCSQPGSDCQPDPDLDPTGTHNHLPTLTDFQAIIDAFANAPFPVPPGAPPGTLPGIKLHIMLNPGEPDFVPHVNECDMVVDQQCITPCDVLDPLIPNALDPCSENTPVSCFDNLKRQFFGTAAERAGVGPACPAGTPPIPPDVRRQQILHAKSRVFRYSLWGHQQSNRFGGVGEGATFGSCLVGHDVIEETGNDMLFTLWGFADQINGSPELRAGTFMHELGHNLGLGHGGGDKINHKPNYLSVMNYLFPAGIPSAGGSTPPVFDYSREALAALDEFNLNENTGVGGPATLRTGYSCPDGRILYVPANMPIDWNCDGDVLSTGVRNDVNTDRYCILQRGDQLDSLALSDDEISFVHAYIDWGPDEKSQSGVAHVVDPGDVVTATSIEAGPDFVLTTTALFDDEVVQRIDPGSPGGSVLAIPAASDDIIGFISAGANGVLETPKQAADIFEPVGAPVQTLITPGPDGILQTRSVAPGSDDVLTVQWILPGADLKLDTLPQPGDRPQPHLLTAGPDGVLDSAQTLAGVQPGDIFDGETVWVGPDVTLQTLAAGDDVVRGVAIVDGLNRYCQSVLVGDDEISSGYWDGQPRATWITNVDDVQPQTYAGYNDWANIKFEFAGSGAFQFGAHNSVLDRAEPTREDVKRQQEAQATADVSITAIALPGTISAGTTFGYRVTLSNAGPDAALGVNAGLVLSTPAAFVACTAPDDVACTGSGFTRGIRVDSLEPGQTVEVELEAEVLGCGFGEDVVLTGSFKTGSTDPNAANDSVELATPISGSAPVFTGSLPELTISTCSNVTLPAPAVKSECGSVTLTNDQPSRFPLGRTIVTWTATSSAGGIATATQAVTAVLGDDTSCCPTGTNVITGTSNNNALNGTSGADCILGKGGQDTINGNGGDDVISGGEGNDVINGGDGNDRLYGGTGQDTLQGGNGSDTVHGNDGDDICRGGIGADAAYGGQGQDQLFGESGDDSLFGQDGSDTLDGGDGNDYLEGARGGNDQCSGGTGANLFSGCETAGLANACADGSQNGSETAVDCGGTGCGGCEAGLACNAGSDCLGGVCSNGACLAPLAPVAAVLAITADWGSGYCVTIEATNVSSTSLSSWNVTLNMNASSITSVSHGSHSATTGVVHITPASGYTTIAAGTTQAGVGFCANRSASGAIPTLLATSGSP